MESMWDVLGHSYMDEHSSTLLSLSSGATPDAACRAGDIHAAEHAIADTTGR
jgi:hypothetical protein